MRRLAVKLNVQNIFCKVFCIPLVELACDSGHPDVGQALKDTSNEYFPSLTL